MDDSRSDALPKPYAYRHHSMALTGNQILIKVPAFQRAGHLKILIVNLENMWNTPSEEELAKIPPLYATEDIPLDKKTIHLHFFYASYNWYIAEYDGNDLFFGYTVPGDSKLAEWGYSSFKEMREFTGEKGLKIDRDLNFKPTPFKELGC